VEQFLGLGFQEGMPRCQALACSDLFGGFQVRPLTGHAGI